MADATSQTSTDTGDGSSTTTTTDTTTNTGEADLTKLSGDDLKKVLENPELYKQPRIAEALQAQKDLKKLQEQQKTDKEKSLTEQNKFKELAEERDKENQTLKSQLQQSTVNSQLITKLAGMDVVDVDGALKLIDRSKITIDDDGQVTGVEAALESLKTDKAYLFKNAGTGKVGSASNVSSSQSGQPGRYKFKESQITPEFYTANSKELAQAAKDGLIEPDGPPPA